MPNEYLDNINLNGTIYDIKDTVSGYMSDVQVNGTSIVNSGTANLITNTAYNATSNKLATMADIGAAGGGTVTSVGIQNATNGGMTISNSPVTSSGNIVIGHTNVLANAQTTSGVYPIKIDKNGHITEYGEAVNIPSAANDGILYLSQNGTRPSALFTANQSGNTTLNWETASVGSASGWNAGSVPTLGTNIAADDITSWTTNTPTEVDITKFSGGSFTQGTFTQGSFTQGTDSFTANTPTVIDTTKFNGGSFTRGSFSGGGFSQGSDNFTPASLSSGFYTVGTAADFGQGQDTFTPATHGNDSFVPNTPTAIDVSKFNGGDLTASLGSNTATADNPTTLTISFTKAALSNGFVTAGTAASYTQGTFNGGAFVQGADQFTSNTPTTIDTTKFNGGSFTQGVDSFTPATHSSDSFTPASLASGFYTAGTAASFTQGTDVYVKPTHASDSFTPASIASGFVTAGTSAALSYTPKSIPNITNVGTAPSLTITPTTVVNNIESL